MVPTLRCWVAYGCKGPDLNRRFPAYEADEMTTSLPCNIYPRKSVGLTALRLLCGGLKNNIGVYTNSLETPRPSFVLLADPAGLEPATI